MKSDQVGSDNNVAEYLSTIDIKLENLVNMSDQLAQHFHSGECFLRR
jgi:hypothetical protein